MVKSKVSGAYLPVLKYIMAVYQLSILELVTQSFYTSMSWSIIKWNHYSTYLLGLLERTNDVVNVKALETVPSTVRAV